MSNRDYTDLIEQYVSGTISDSDKVMLESEFLSNPSLRGEVEFQREMVNGLQQFRKAELKARLDNVPVEVGVMQTLGQSTLVKVAASIGVTALVIGGIYYFSEPAVEKVASYERLSPAPLTEEFQAGKKLDVKELTRVELPKAPAAAPEEEVPLAEESEVVTKEEEVVPVFDKPSVKEFENEEEFEGNPVGEDATPLISNPSEINMPIDIEVKSRLSFDNKLQYQFYEEKLYLFGDFGNIPYEILEINSKTGKKLYLYHQGIFYKLSYPTRKVTELEKVTSGDLIKELNIFRESKAHN